MAKNTFRTLNIDEMATSKEIGISIIRPIRSGVFEAMGNVQYSYGKSTRKSIAA
jgi:hypothetical protein